MVTPAKLITVTQTKAPNLNNAPDVYNHQFENLLLNNLRLYFNEIDNFTNAINNTVTGGGDITFPDGTVQTTAYVAGNIEAYDLSSSITVNSTPTLLTPANFINAQNITYNSSTGVFTFNYKGGFALSLVVNALASAAIQILYIYAQTNTGSGWVNNANSGKSYQLINGQVTQVVFPQAVTRTVGEQVRYYIYSNDGHVTLQTSTLPGVTPTVYVPAIRIQYAG
jgi:uncharacterized protein involved in outer membrane biogenesis